MIRPWVLASLSGCAVLLLGTQAVAQPSEPAARAPVEPNGQAVAAPTPGSEAAQSDLLSPTPPEWKLAYDDARARLSTGDFAAAATLFRDLERSAVNRVDRALAREQASLAEDWATRGLAFVHRQDLGESGISAKAIDLRTTDELVSLYTNGVFYGIGTGIWLSVAGDLEARGAILASIGATGATVGTIAGLDGGRGLRYGVAQSIVSGLYVGLEEGVVWAAFAAAQKDTSWSAAGVSTFIWSFSTAGAIAGGVMGSTLGTTPGRSSWVGSVALWSGVVPTFLTVATTPENKAPPTGTFAVAGLGLTLGTGIGLATAGRVSPSIARVRFIDLGGLSGGLLSAGLYAALASKPNPQAGFALTGLGTSAGLVTAFVLTSSMPEDRPRAAAVARADVRPMVLPIADGVVLGVGGTVD